MRVILPRCYLDAVTVGTGGAVRLVNRDPEPGERDISADTGISLDVVAADGGEVVAGSVNISVEVGAPSEIEASALLGAVVDGVVQPGWDGPGAGVVVAAPEILKITMVPPGPFPSLTIVVVEVSAETTAGGFGTIRYSFVVEDLDAPAAMTARALNAFTVEVAFDEAISESSSNPGLWSLVPLEPPAWFGAPASVEVRGNVALLRFPEELTFGRLYAVVASGVADVAGNAAPELSAEFASWRPAADPRRRIGLWKMLPADLRRRDRDGGAEARVAIWQDVVDVLLRIVDDFHKIYDPDLAPVPFLDAMLADLGNPLAAVTPADVIKRRKLAKNLVEIYGVKGTEASIVLAARLLLGIEVAVVVPHADGWILGESALGEGTILGGSGSRYKYSFAIEAPRALTPEERDVLGVIAEKLKPAHTHLLEIREPQEVVEPDHWQLGASRLGVETILH